jgi:hypothetical protein
MLVAVPACYHATIETGQPLAAETIQQNWAHGFLFGLVPPSTVASASKCRSGVAKVETQQSFLNMVANVLTGGIYTPMTITVTCAAGPTVTGSIINVPNDPTTALAKAVELSSKTGSVVYARY